MEQIWTLLAFSVSMFLGCYLAGSIPLVLTLSEKVLRRLTVLGAGLLIGTALIVIIPEGIESLFSGSTRFSQKSETRAIKGIIPDGQVANKEEAVITKKQALPELMEPWLGGMEDDSLQFLMGVSLVLGFIFMLVIDQLSGTHSHTEVDTVRQRGGATATIGLVVHAAADGLALGAAAGLSKTDVEFVIFLAIMLHKAPAAFGFVSFLMHEGYDKQTARYHLLLFALAAPLAAFFSYFGLVRIMYITQVPITGITMLFSAGTFLYVSTVHVLNEVTHMSSSSDGNGATSKLTPSEIVIVVTGALLPLIFNIIHSH